MDKCNPLWTNFSLFIRGLRVEVTCKLCSVCRPAHDLVCQQDPTHLGVLVLALEYYHLHNANTSHYRDSLIPSNSLLNRTVVNVVIQTVQNSCEQFGGLTVSSPRLSSRSPTLPSPLSCPSIPSFLASLLLQVGPLNPARESGERCKLPKRGLGRSPRRN